MRLVASIIIALFISTILFFITKLWGTSYQYIDYKHPFYENIQTPLQFKAVKNTTELQHLAQTEQALYVKLAITADQKVIVHFSEQQTTTFRNKLLSELSKEIAEGLVVELALAVPMISNHKVIFDLTENPMSGPDIILTEFKKNNLSEGKQFIFTGGYEAPIKELKTSMPAWLFGATQPEILKIKALESLYLIEAAIYRADFIIHPLKYYNKDFFTETLLNDTKRRFKRIIIGPIKSSAELDESLKLKPFGVIISF